MDLLHYNTSLGSKGKFQSQFSIRFCINLALLLMIRALFESRLWKNTVEWILWKDIFFRDQNTETTCHLIYDNKKWVKKLKIRSKKRLPYYVLTSLTLKTTYHKNFPRDQLLCNKTNILCFEYLFCCTIAGLLENSYDK